jgi:hypothetical protein
MFPNAILQKLTHYIKLLMADSNQMTMTQKNNEQRESVHVYFQYLIL